MRCLIWNGCGDSRLYEDYMVLYTKRKKGNWTRRTRIVVVRRRRRGDVRMEAGGSGMKERDDNGEQTEEVKRQRLAAVELFTLVGQMKTTPRTGWVERGVPRPESVADHSYRMVRHKHTEGDIIKLCHDDSRAREERERERKKTRSTCTYLHVNHHILYWYQCP